MNQTLKKSLTDDILVRDVDGRFKIISDGKLVDIDQYAVAGAGAKTSWPEHDKSLDFPKFTDLAVVPENEHFSELSRAANSGRSRADLQFHPSDTHEIQQELEKLNTVFNLGGQKKYSAIKMARKLADKHLLRLTPDEFKNFTKILLSLFRQTRSFVEARPLLQGPKSAGGLAVPDSDIDHIFNIIRHLKDKIEAADGVVVEEDDVIGPMASVPVPPVVRPPEPVTPKPAIVEAAPPRPAMETLPTQNQAPKPIVTPPIAATPIPVKVAVTKTDAWPRVTRPSSVSNRPGVADVRHPEARRPKLTGRIEELADMNLEMFRLIDTDPRIRVGYILGKIQALERESLTRKAQGIDAWRNNQVYREYLRVGQKSLEQKKNIADVIAEMRAGGRDTLTLEEFEAISDLNKTMRF